MIQRPDTWPEWLEPMTNDYRKTRAVFRSWEAFLDHAANGRSEMPDDERSSRRRACGREAKWQGTETFAEAIRQADEGTDHGVEQMRKYLGILSRKLGERIVQPVYSWAEEGDDFDIGAVLEQRPEAWLQRHDATQERRSTTTQTIYVHAGAWAGVSARAIAQQGAIALATAMLLEQAEIPTRIVVCAGKQYYGADRHSLLIDFKDYSSPTSLSRAAFAFASPAMNRRLIWSHYEQLPRRKREAFDVVQHGGYGQVLNAEGLDQKAIVLHHRGNYINSTDEAVAFIEQTLRDNGVELN